ncbi:unnamed protein product, partial [Mesorhabditis spiculigera]
MDVKKKPKSDQLRWVVIYPAYISKKTLVEGRRIPLAEAVDAPNVPEIVDVLNSIPLPNLVETKMYPRDQLRSTLCQGRVRVQLFSEDGTPLVPEITTRQALYKHVAKLIPMLKTRQQKPVVAAPQATVAAADGANLGRLVFELDTELCPKTCENFASLCRGTQGFGYEGSIFYRVVPGFCACSGDFETQNKDRKGGRSIYGKWFDDENFDKSHDKRGVLSMDNFGWPNTNSSRFFVTFDECRWMDGYHVAFGELVSGWDTLDAVENLGVIEGYGRQKGRTTKEIVISKCGTL